MMERNFPVSIKAEPDRPTWLEQKSDLLNGFQKCLQDLIVVNQERIEEEEMSSGEQPFTRKLLSLFETHLKRYRLIKSLDLQATEALSENEIRAMKAAESCCAPGSKSRREGRVNSRT
jgi:hypothetical protein